MLLSDNFRFTATTLHQFKIVQLLLQILSFFTKIFQNIIECNDKHLRVLMFLQLEYPRFIQLIISVALEHFRIFQKFEIRKPYLVFP